MSHERLSYLQSMDDRYSGTFNLSANPFVNLNEALSEADCADPEHLKVFLRVRPVIADEATELSENNIEILDDHSIVLTAPSNSHAFKSKPNGVSKLTQSFTFNHVYGPSTSQKDMFENTTEELVKEVLQGQNCLLFTYGATNSGKTHTVQGSLEDPGLLPRTLMLLFSSIGSHYTKMDLKPQHFCGVVRLSEKEVKREEEMKESLLRQPDATMSSLSSSLASLSSHLSRESIVSTLSEVASLEELSSAKHSPSSNHNAYFAIYVSFAEIYNEYIYDLLEKVIASKKHKRLPLNLGEDRQGSIYIKGLKYVKVNNVNEAMQVLEVGRQSLHFASTHLNHHSSRSHCIFNIKVVRLADIDNPHVAHVSMLSLCDLAGAERAAKAQNSHDRLKEASNINTSLLVLGRCITALRHNQSVRQNPATGKRAMPVPYRDSKVTRLFQSFFMGKGSLSMIVNISTSSFMFDETLKVLKFSAIARKVAIVQEKAPVELVVDVKAKKSQFSKFMHRSFNMSSNSGRLSAPWNTNKDITFEKTIPDQTRSIETVEEVDENQELHDLIAQLRDRLLKEVKEKQELEINLRKEICDAFSERMVKIEDSWRNRVAEERSRNEELMEWRINQALEGTVSKCRKRQRLDDTEDDEKVSVVLLHQEEVKVNQLTEEIKLLKEELEAIKGTLKMTTQSFKEKQEENSKLQFQLSNQIQLSNAFEQARNEKFQLGALNISSQESGTNNDIVCLQKKLCEMKEELSKTNKDNKELRDMLQEAAEEFIEKETKVGTLTSQLTGHKQDLTNQTMVINELESQLSETRQMLTNQVLRIEEREHQIHELRTEIISLKSNDPESEKIVANENKMKCEGMEQNFLKEKNQLLLKIKDLEYELQHLKNNSTLKSKETKHIKNEMETIPPENIKLEPKTEELTTSLENNGQLYTQKQDSDITSKYATLELMFQKLNLLNDPPEFEGLEERVTLLLKEQSEFKSIEGDLRQQLCQSTTKNTDIKSLLDEKLTEMSQLEEQYNESSNNKNLEINQLREDCKNLELKISNLNSNLANIESTHKTQTEEAQNQINTLKTELEDQQTVCNNYLKDIESLQEEKNISNAELLEVNSRIKNFEKEIIVLTELKDQIENEKQTLRQEMEDTVHDLKVKIQYLEQSLDKATEERALLKADLDATSKMQRDYDQMKIDYESLRSKNTELETLQIEQKTKIEQLVKNLDEKNAVFDKLSQKVDKLDRKLDKQDLELQTTLQEKEVLLKEVNAMREARKIEVEKHITDICDKDAEIASLQTEVKNSLQFSTLSENKTSTRNDIKVDLDESKMRTLEDQLRDMEKEKSLLHDRVNDLEKQLTSKSDQYSAKKRGGRSPSFDTDTFITPTPSKRATRSTRKKPIESTSSLTEDMPAPKSRTLRKSRKKQTEDFQSTDVTESEDIESEDFEPSTAKKTTKSSRGKAKRSSKLANPHIEPKICNTTNKENVPAPTRSSRRRRPLFNLTAEEAYECEPNLLPPSDLPQDSPHTLVKRQLRRKGK